MAWAPKGNIKGPKGDKGDTGNTGSQGPAGATGAQGPKGDQGTAGSTGAQGPQGVPGAAGEVWWSGAGAPAGGTGAVGDWYIDNTTGNYYEKTASSTWTQRGTLKGPQGAQGPQGATGNTGSQGPAGVGVPAGGVLGAILRKKSATDYDTEWKPLANLSTAQLSAAALVGVAAKMLGLGALGAVMTPTATGKVLVIITSGSYTMSGGTFFGLASMRYGTGTPPANGVAQAGNAAGGTTAQTQSVVNQPTALMIAAVVTGLVVGTQYWFDLVVQGSNAAAVITVNYPTVQVIELP